MAKQQTITTLPRSPQDDRHGRMIKYSIAMGIRTLCIVACLFVRDWWLLIPAVGAVVLPYFAVVIANVSSKSGSVVESPGGIVPVAPQRTPDGLTQRPAAPGGESPAEPRADGGDREGDAA